MCLVIMNTKVLATKIINELKILYPDAKPMLAYSSPYELLVAVILSAQCTDERVNKVTSVLFKNYNTPQKMVMLSQEELETYIKSCGLFRNKAKHILSASKDLIDKFDGQVPDKFDKLLLLDGVGRKTANVVYSVAFFGDAIAVDTHVFRVSKRMGLSCGKTPEQVEKDLQKVVDKSLWSKSHHYLIYHGRKVCKAISPDCENCSINKICKKVGVKVAK